MEWSEELCGGLLRAVPDAIVVVKDTKIVLVNDRVEELFGYAEGDLVGQEVDLLLTDSARAAYSGTLLLGSFDEAGGPMDTLALTVRRRGGGEFPAEVSLSAVPTPQGRFVVAVVRDVSERVHAEIEQTKLRAKADYQRVEAQLHRNRWLESLGQLAGGVAHDFNNMLGVIVNYAGFVIEEAAAPQPDLAAIAADAQQIVQAGERGTDLTHQLLAFARREVVRPQLLDLDQCIAELEPSLRRSLGEQVTLTIQPAAGLPLVAADPGQVEQILVNLVLNGRDAMPAGGRVTIDTSVLRVGGSNDAVGDDLLPGEYVCLRIGDSGGGMPPEVIERAFEPFFTTKRSGAGTGLGLATVYGIVTQAAGDVSIASEHGVGTTVTVLLPVVDPPEAAAPVGQEPLTEGHGEGLLVAEDEAPLRDVVGRILGGAGYQVLAADGGAQVLAVAARPDTQVLFMSDYAQPILASAGPLEPGVMLLEKPFTADELLRAVRHRLDGG